MDELFHKMPDLAVCSHCAQPAWVEAMKEDGSGSITWCTYCEKETTLRLRTVAEQMEREAAIYNYFLSKYQLPSI